MKSVIQTVRSLIIIAAACVPADGFAGGAPITPPGMGAVTVQKIGPGEARRGQTITYTITIPAVTAAVWGVDLTDPKVQGLTYLSVTSALNACQIAGGGVRCHWNDIHPGSPRTATVTARVDDSAPCNLPIVNRATVTVTKPQANVFAEASTLITCDNVPPTTPPACSDGIDNDGDGWIDLEDSGCGGNPYGTTEHNSPPNDGGLIITKVQTRSGMELPGGKVMYLITFQNNTGAGLWDVTVTDPTPPGLLLWNAPPGCNKSTAGFICKIADVPAGRSFTFNPVYKVPDGVPCGTQYPNTVTVTSTKPTYRTASATGTAFICDTPAPACSDGQDNDGDGKRDFPADPGCSSPQDPDETDPKPQCSDGIDNDGDLKIDAADPGCSNPYDNNESDDPKPACSDGIDNDGDYLIDLADPGCVNANDPDEYNPRSECSDGIDNDGDGWIDFPEDGGCYSAQDTSEKDPNGPQCDNGRDDDYDGKTDFPADPSCSGPKDTTEHAPQCSDGADNDSDGAIDFPADYSCASGDDSDETTPKAQCQDSSDNDGDGWIDFPEDTGCSSKQDNSENTENLMPSCSNGKDDDGDGKIDFPADPGCTDAADNDEYNSTSQCSDGYDNDSDGWVDLEDSGCENAADNSELNTAGAIEPVVECVANNGDGSYSAFFGYVNANSAAFSIPAGANGAAGKNTFSPADPDRGQGSAFEPGRVFGSTVVVFDGSPLTWTIQPAGGPEKSVTAKFGISPVCPKLKPITECVMALPAGGFQATFGYKNDFTFQVKIPVGPYNKFSPAPEDRAQPTNFFTGRVNNYITVASSSGAALTWKLGTEEAVATSSSTPCMPGAQPDPSVPPGTACTATDTVGSKVDLAKGLSKQSELVSDAIVRLQSVAPGGDTAQFISGVQSDLARLTARNTEILAAIPADVKTCVGASCQPIDQQPLLDEYRANTEALRTLVKKTLRRVEQAVGSATQADKKLAKKADKHVEKILAIVVTLPRFHSQC